MEDSSSFSKRDLQNARVSLSFALASLRYAFHPLTHNLRKL